MGRALIGALVVALLAIAIGWRWSAQQHAIQERQTQQIADLSAQVGKLTSENETLKNALDKVQDEEARLTRANDALEKALQEAKLTGKVPNLPPPYPPK